MIINCTSAAQQAAAAACQPLGASPRRSAGKLLEMLLSSSIKACSPCGGEIRRWNMLQPTDGMSPCWVRRSGAVAGSCRWTGKQGEPSLATNATHHAVQTIRRDANPCFVQSFQACLPNSRLSATWQFSGRRNTKVMQRSAKTARTRLLPAWLIKCSKAEVGQKSRHRGRPFIHFSYSGPSNRPEWFCFSSVMRAAAQWKDLLQAVQPACC